MCTIYGRLPHHKGSLSITLIQTNEIEIVSGYAPVYMCFSSQNGMNSMNLEQLMAAHKFIVQA